MSVAPLKLDPVTALPARMGAGDVIPAANIPVVPIPTNDQTGTTYTMTATDAGKRIRMSNASANTVTIDASVLTVGAGGLIQQIGAGQTTVAAAVGTTIVKDGATLKAAALGAMLYWLCDSATQVTVGGRVAAS